jgi:hypothetical protein
MRTRHRRKTRKKLTKTQEEAIIAFERASTRLQIVCAGCAKMLTDSAYSHTAAIVAEMLQVAVFDYTLATNEKVKL